MPGNPFPDKTQNPMLIGGNRFIGTIEAVRISKVARYTEDFTPPIAFTADKDTFALYRFDEGQGDVLKDSSGNNRHGQIKGAKWVRLDGSAITAPQAVGTAQKKAPPLAVAPFDAQQARAHQEAWAKHLGVPVEYTNALGVKFVLIPPGEFLMGSGEQETKGSLDSPPEGDADHYRNVRKWRASQTPQRRVRLTQPRYLGLHEVTQRQYEQVMGANPSEYAKTGPNKEIAGLVANLDTSNFPVDSVSWQEAIEVAKEADRLPL